MWPILWQGAGWLPSHQSKKILEHFTDGNHATKDKRSYKELIIPNHLEQGRGQELIDNVNAHAIEQVEEYDAIIC